MSRRDEMVMHCRAAAAAAAAAVVAGYIVRWHVTRRTDVAMKLTLQLTGHCPCSAHAGYSCHAPCIIQCRQVPVSTWRHTRPVTHETYIESATASQSVPCKTFIIQQQQLCSPPSHRQMLNCRHAVHWNLQDMTQSSQNTQFTGVS